MRCQFCGWDNPNGAETCEKCNKPLAGNMYSGNFAAQGGSQNFQSRPTERQVAGTDCMRKTVREIPNDGKSKNNDESKECPKCGYLLEDGKCPACGYLENDALQYVKLSGESRKTTRPIRKVMKSSGFKLIPISEETGNPEGDQLSFAGNIVVLNRENTDPENSTITSQNQANLTFEDGAWFIEDKSEFKTTFVQAAHKIELQDGDLILIGNQLYRFGL